MRKLILAMLAVAFCITLSYAESCSSGQGSLSYQISGCGEQRRACCSGTWCSWGTSSCASCTATSTTNSRNCSGNVSGACAGTQTQSCTRSVTGSCGSSCSYSGWSCGGWSGSCTYTQSCTATSESRNCSGNVSGACAGTQSRSRSVTGTCGSCSYGSWSGWSGSCTYTQSCTATSESRNCSGNVSGACAGTQSRSRSVTGTCGSCSYGSWSGWSGSCTYTQSCTATSESRNCSGNVSGACAGTQSRSRSVTGTCGSCSYGSWSAWSGSCTYTQSCTATSDSTACSNVSSSYCGGTATRTRSVTGSCGSCSYGSWGSWNTGSCSSYSYSNSYYTDYDSDSTSCRNVSSSYTSGTAYRERSRSCYDTYRYCGGSYSGYAGSSCGSYGSWGSWDTSSCVGQTCEWITTSEYGWADYDEQEYYFGTQKACLNSMKQSTWGIYKVGLAEASIDCTRDGDLYAWCDCYYDYNMENGYAMCYYNMCVWDCW